MVYPSATNNETVANWLGKASQFPFSSMCTVAAEIHSTKMYKYSRFYFRTINLRPNLLSVDLCAHGYPKLAAFLDSDPNFMIYCRFGYLQTRLLLYHRDILRELELEMDCIDRREANDPATKR